MNPDLSMTRQAAAICTPAQFAAILVQLGEARRMRVFIDYSLPTGYLYFIRSGEYNGETHSIYGGIDPDGGIST